MSFRAKDPKRVLEASVQWWNRSSIYVLCPNCEEIHRHGFDGVYERIGRRLSHCASMTDHCVYSIQFPFDEATGFVGFELDKARALYVSDGANPTEYFEREDDRSLCLAPQTRRIWTEAIETIYLEEEQCGLPGGDVRNRLDWVVQEMIAGNVDCVRHYLDSYAESEIFIHGTQSWEVNQYDQHDEEKSDGDSQGSERTYTTGKTCLHIAACEQYPDVVNLLLRKGADPNARDTTSRTPLAEAALWGRLDNVKLLLYYGAEKELECVRYGKRLRAVDFARPLRANRDERYSLSGGSSQIYKENTYQRDLDRSAIVQLLEDVAENPDRGSNDLGGFAFTTSHSNEHLLTLIAYFNLPGESKTIGVLYRGNGLAPVAAMSGWSHQKDANINIQIGGRDWTSEVRRLCAMIGHRLQPHPCDQGQAGRYHACHAEKQLIAFFVHKHLFLECETEAKAGMAALNLDDLSEEDYKQLQEEKRSREMMSDLKSVSPATSLKKAKIMVCRPLCQSGDCARFVQRINEFFSLDIMVACHILKP